MGGIPPAKEGDAEDVVWALQTAEALWKREERVDAIVWIRRAAQAAADAQDDVRAAMLARSAADLTEHVAESVAPDAASIPVHEPAGEAIPSAVDALLHASASGVTAALDAPPEPILDRIPAPIVTERDVGEDEEARVSVPTAEQLHAGILDPWAEQPVGPAPAVAHVTERVESAPPPRFEDEVVTSARPMPFLPASAFPEAEPSTAPKGPPPVAASEPAPSIHMAGEIAPLPLPATVAVPPPPPVPAAAPVRPAAPKPPPVPPRPPPLQKKPPAPPSRPRAPSGSPPPGTKAVAKAPAPAPAAPSPPPPPPPMPAPSSRRIVADAAPAPTASTAVSTNHVAPAPGLDLEGVEAFADLPDDAREKFALAARVTVLSTDEEVASFALAYVVEGEVDSCATMVDAPAVRYKAGAVLRSRGSIDDQVPLRLICASDRATVAVWHEAEVEAAFKTCPWVEDDLRAAADLAQALAGVTVGPLGERLDRSLRDSVMSRLELKVLQAGDVLVEKGKPVPGLLIVGVGHLDLADGDKVAQSLGSGDFVFADAVLHAGPAPFTARAGKAGALVMSASRHVAQELLVTCPPLLELFAGM